MLRGLGWIALGLALGFGLGGIPARREKAQLAEENRDLREQIRNAGAGPNLFGMLFGGGRLGPMGGALEAEVGDVPRERSQASAPDGRPANPEQEVTLDDSPRVQGEVSVVEGTAQADGTVRSQRSRTEGATASDAPDRPRTAEERRARTQQLMQSLTQSRFKQFATAQSARAAATRSTLISSGNLTDSQVARLDSAIDSTNRKLQGYGEEMLTNVAQGKEPEPAEALSLARDVADILHEGQTELDRLVSESGGEVPESATQIWNLVDPEGLVETAVRVLPENPPEGLDALADGLPGQPPAGLPLPPLVRRDGGTP